MLIMNESLILFIVKIITKNKMYKFCVSKIRISWKWRILQRITLKKVIYNIKYLTIWLWTKLKLKHEFNNENT